MSLLKIALKLSKEKNVSGNKADIIPTSNKGW